MKDDSIKWNQRWTKFSVIYTESPSSFTWRHPVFSPSLVVKTLFFRLIRKLSVCCVHVCAHVCLCVTMPYMHTWKPESHITCLSSSIDHRVFGDRVFHRTSKSPLGPDGLASMAQASPCCYLLALRIQVCIHIWLFFYMDSGIWLLVLTPAH